MNYWVLIVGRSPLPSGNVVSNDTDLLLLSGLRMIDKLWVFTLEWILPHHSDRWPPLLHYSNVFWGVVWAGMAQEQNRKQLYVYLPTSRLYYLLFSLVSFKLMTQLTQFTPNFCNFWFTQSHMLADSGCKVPISHVVMSSFGFGSVALWTLQALPIR